MIPSLNLATQSGVSGATTSGATSGGGGAVSTFPTTSPDQIQKWALIGGGVLLALVVIFKLAGKK